MDVTDGDLKVFKYLERHYAFDLGESAQVVRRITDGTRDSKPKTLVQRNEMTALSSAI